MYLLIRLNGAFNLCVWLLLPTRGSAISRPFPQEKISISLDPSLRHWKIPLSALPESPLVWNSPLNCCCSCDMLFLLQSRMTSSRAFLPLHLGDKMMKNELKARRFMKYVPEPSLYLGSSDLSSISIRIAIQWPFIWESIKARRFKTSVLVFLQPRSSMRYQTFPLLETTCYPGQISSKVCLVIYKL